MLIVVFCSPIYLGNERLNVVGAVSCELAHRIEATYLQVQSSTAYRVLRVPLVIRFAKVGVSIKKTLVCIARLSRLASEELRFHACLLQIPLVCFLVQAVRLESAADGLLQYAYLVHSLPVKEGERYCVNLNSETTVA